MDSGASASVGSPAVPAAVVPSKPADSAGGRPVIIKDDGPDIPAWEDLPEEVAGPAASAPTPSEPMPLQPALHAPARQGPASEEPVSQEPVLQEPVSQEPAAQESGSKEPLRQPEGGESEPGVSAWEDLSDTEPDTSSWVPVMEDDMASFEGSEWEPVMSAESDFEVAALAPLAKDAPASRSRAPRLARMTAQQWPALAASLPLTGLAAELAKQSEWVGVDDDTITLRVAVRSLAVSKGQARLRTVLTEHFGKVVQLKVEFGATGGGTAHAMELKRRAQRQKEAEDAVANDPFVRTLQEEFGARVMPGSIAAVDEVNAA